MNKKEGEVFIMRCSYKFLFEGIGISNNNLGQKLIMNMEHRGSKAKFNDTQDFSFKIWKGIYFLCNFYSLSKCTVSLL